MDTGVQSIQIRLGLMCLTNEDKIAKCLKAEVNSEKESNIGIDKKNSIHSGYWLYGDNCIAWFLEAGEMYHACHVGFKTCSGQAHWLSASAAPHIFFGINCIKLIGRLGCCLVERIDAGMMHTT
jgi:hypothetical protein